jgi:hypothetical protein
MSARLAFYLTPVEQRGPLVEFIHENFILLDVDGYAPGGSKEEVAWWLKVQGREPGDGCGANAWYVASAGGKRLCDPVVRGLPDLEKALAYWKTLPEEERKPNLFPLVQDSSMTARLAPPAGALILRAYFSFLDTPDSGDPAPVRQTRWYSTIINTRMPGTDVMWVTEKEWKAMIPSNPRKGELLVFPPTLQNRILTYYASPEMIGWNNRPYGQVREGEFTLTVDDASDEGFRLRLEGYARKGQVFDAKSTEPMGGDFRFLGYLHFDAQAKAFDRFDMVALGKGWGSSGEPANGAGTGTLVEYVPVYERAARPYGVGIAYQLVSGKRQADRVPPGPGHNGYPGWTPETYLGKQ